MKQAWNWLKPGEKAFLITLLTSTLLFCIFDILLLTGKIL